MTPDQVWSNAVLAVGAGLVLALLPAVLAGMAPTDRRRSILTGAAAAALVALAVGGVATYFAVAPTALAGQLAGSIFGLLAAIAVGVLVLRPRRWLAVSSGFMVVAATALPAATFLWSSVRATPQTAGPLLGVLLGAGAAAAVLIATHRAARGAGTRAWPAALLVLLTSGTALAAAGAAVAAVDGLGGRAAPGARTLAPGTLGAVLARAALGSAARPTVLQAGVGLLVALAVAAALWSRPAVGGETEVRQGPDRGPLRPWPVGGRTVGAVTAAAGLSAGLVIGVSSIGGAVRTSAVALTADACAPAWSTPRPGRHRFAVTDTSRLAGTVSLTDGTTTVAVASVGPGTTVPVTADLAPGRYLWQCHQSSGPVAVSGEDLVQTGASAAIAPLVTVNPTDMDAAIATYRQGVLAGLHQLAAAAERVAMSVRTGDLRQARARWLPAHLDYARLGAAYGTFAQYAEEIDGRADGLPGGVHDPSWRGFLRLEYGLWHDQTRSELLPVATALALAVRQLIGAFPDLPTPLIDLPTRAHEILENTLQFELTGDTDEGSGTNLATAQANVEGTEAVLVALGPLLFERAPGLQGAADARLQSLSALLGSYDHAGRWEPLADLSIHQREVLDGAVDGLLAELAPIPDLLQVSGEGDPS